MSATQPEPQSATTGVSAEGVTEGDSADAVATDAGTHAAAVVAEVPVTVQRSVRYGRVIVGAAVVCAVIAAVVTLAFPVLPGASYTLPQAVGMMSVVGAIVGLGIGALSALVLSAFAKRQHGAGVAIQSDVR